MTAEHELAGRRRVRYAITEEGRARLRDWIAQPPEPSHSSRDALLLRVFFGAHAEPGVLAGHLSDHRRSLVARLEQLGDVERLVTGEDGRDRPYWLATVRHGLHHLRAAIAWTDETLALLAAEEARP